MATTTNYSWTTPDDTALVKDGAAAIRSLGTAIDSTVFTNAGAAVTKATVDAKGDLIAGTADNTVARLAVGANDTVLTADSSTATGLKWAAPAGGAGNLDLITNGTLSGTSVTISSLSNYTDLYVLLEDPNWATGNSDLIIRINSSSAGNYWYNGFFHSGTSAFARFNTSGWSSVNITPNGARNGAFGTNHAINFNNCKNAGYTKFETFAYNYTGGGSTVDVNFIQGVFQEAAAVSTLTITTSNGYTFNGGTYRIYGA